jgi:hypothetical protein
MSDDKEPVEAVEANEESTESEMDLTAAEATDDGGFDKGRQQIQQEIGNKIRPLESQIAELKEMLSAKNTPKDDDILDDDDYLTASQARSISANSNNELSGTVQQLRGELQKIQHKNDFLTEYPGVNYNDTLEKAFALAREDNPGVPDNQLGQTAGGYMRRMARGKGKTEPVTTKSSQSKKAPDSTKGASVSNSSAPVPNDSQEYKELSQDEIQAKYFSEE